MSIANEMRPAGEFCMLDLGTGRAARRAYAHAVGDEKPWIFWSWQLVEWLNVFGSAAAFVCKRWRDASMLGTASTCRKPIDMSS